MTMIPCACYADFMAMTCQLLGGTPPMNWHNIITMDLQVHQDHIIIIFLLIKLGHQLILMWALILVLRRLLVLPLLEIIGVVKTIV